MALRLPPLSGLRLFEAAARCGSFKLAAHELNLTPGAVSHGIDKASIRSSIILLTSITMWPHGLGEA
jgi:hypothetical protein